MPLSRFLRPLLALTALLCANAAEAQTAAYVISDHTTGYILEQSQGDKKLPIASLTKIATAMVVLDWAAQSKADLSRLATVPASAARLSSGQGGVGFQTGDKCSLRDLLYAALLQSDNVAAQTLAEHVGMALRSDRLPPADAFVVQMNALARSLGMSRTRFLNAHGLDNLERTIPQSTAADLAKLTSYAMANAAFRFHVAQKERKIAIIPAAPIAVAPAAPFDPDEPSFPEPVAAAAPPPPGPTAYLLRNTNELLGVDGIDGVKTGTTARAGQCLIISASKPPETRQEGGQHIITPRRVNIVILGSTNRFDTARRLLDRGWGLYGNWAAAGRPVKARR